ncbi:MAG: DUF484 family protein [Rhodobacteraceae bacterium]|nr:DUF484 family protein [Paracoccaceae bacterium]
MTRLKQKTDEPDLHQVRSLIRENPDIVLKDLEIMRELAVHAQGRLGENVVDLRGAAMKVLDRRRDELEEVNRELVATSHENMSSIHRIHLSVLQLMEADNLGELRIILEELTSGSLQVSLVRLLLEGQFENPGTRTDRGETIRLCKRGEIATYFGNADRLASGRIILRAVTSPSTGTLGPTDIQLRSEALLPLTFRNGHRNGLLILGSRNSHKFEAGMATDLLEFFRLALERVAWRLLV